MIIPPTPFNLCNNNSTIPYLRHTFRTKRDRRFKKYNFILPRLVNILRVFCGFQKSLAESESLKSITITYWWLPRFFLTDRDLHYAFQMHKVVDNSVNDSPSLMTQPLVFCYRGHLGNEWPAFTFICTFYYHAYTHTVFPRIDLMCTIYLMGVVHDLFQGHKLFCSSMWSVRILIEGTVYSGRVV